MDHVTTPLTGARRALACIGAKNIIYIAPYLSEISETMCQKFEEYGFRIVGAGTFGEEKDSIVGQISPQSIKDAILQLISSCSDSVDAIFVACTSMKCAPIINEVEQELGVSVISSNSAISWDMARLSGLKFSKKQKGALFKQN